MTAPLSISLRRLRARPLSTLGLALAFAGAAALIGWASLTAARSGRMVIRLLQQAVPDAGTTVVAASHDPDVIGAADARLTLAETAATATG